MPYDTGPDNDFLDITPKVQATKSKNSQVGLHKIKLLHNRGSNQQSEKANHEMGEKTFTNYTLMIYSKIHKVLLQLKRNKKSNNPQKNRQRI